MAAPKGSGKTGRKRPAKQDVSWDPEKSFAYMQEQFRTQKVAALAGIEDAATSIMSAVGIHLPHLALRYLYQRNSFPLERSQIIFGPTGCVAGSTMIRINRAGNGVARRIDRLVTRLDGGGPAPQWDLSIDTYVTRAVGDHARLAKLKSAWACGDKETFTLTTKAGRSIRATAEHPFCCADGTYRRLADLRVGDSVQVYVGRVATPRRRRKYRDAYTRYHPRQRTCVDGAKMPVHRLVYEAKLNGMDYASYLAILRTDEAAAARLTYLPKGAIVHHVDNDTLNNDPDNLEHVESPTEHVRQHYDDIDGNVLPKIGLDEIVSIERFGVEPTYDLEVDDDPHCYIANDFVVHNSNKSALLYWFYKLFGTVGGMYVHVEAEDKDTPKLRASVLDYKDCGWGRKCRSLNDVQSMVRAGFDFFKSKCGVAGGPGKTVPVVIGVDSLVAKMTEEAYDTVDEDDGVTNRRFADEARALSDWFKVVPNYLQDWPFCLIAINHYKPKPVVGRSQQVNHHTPGGTAPNYYATYRLRTAVVAKIKQTASGWEGNRISIVTEKCGLASTGRKIEVEFKWRMEPMRTATGREVIDQRSVWDWDKATTETLYGLMTNEKEKARGDAVREVLKLQRVSGGRYYSKAIDVGSDDALSAADFGRALEKRPDVLAQLEPHLGIHDGCEFAPKLSFDAQRAAAIARAPDVIPVAYVLPADGEIVEEGDETDGAGTESAGADGDGEEAAADE